VTDFSTFPGKKETCFSEKSGVFYKKSLKGHCSGKEGSLGEDAIRCSKKAGCARKEPRRSAPRIRFPGK